MFGVPDHRNPEYGALKHLRAVLEAAVRKSKCYHRRTQGRKSLLEAKL